MIFDPQILNFSSHLLFCNEIECGDVKFKVQGKALLVQHMFPTKPNKRDPLKSTSSPHLHCSFNLCNASQVSRDIGSWAPDLSYSTLLVPKIRCVESYRPMDS